MDPEISVPRVTPTLCHMWFKTCVFEMHTLSWIQIRPAGATQTYRLVPPTQHTVRWMANDVSNLTVHCSPLGVKDMFVSMAMKMSRPEPSCGHGPDKTSANTV